MQDGLVAGGHVVQGAVTAVVEAPAAAFEQQHHEVHEREPHAARDHRLARRDRPERGVGGLLGREVAQTVLLRVRDQAGLGVGRRRVEMPGGEDEDVGRELAVALEQYPVRGPAAYTDRARPVAVHPHLGRERREGATQHPVQVVALEAPGGEGGGPEGAQLVADRAVRDRLAVEGAVADRHRPLVQRGAGDDRPVDDAAVVGEHGDVGGHGVHPQQRRLVLAPDPPGPVRVGVDEVDVEVDREPGGTRGDPLEDPGTAGATADDHDRGHAPSLSVHLTVGATSRVGHPV